MLIKSKFIKDTVMLTVMQLFLDTAALVLNVFITRKLGASAIGILSLMGSFLGLAGIISNGNAFLCTSRLISEELGKRCGDPGGILFHGIKLCLVLSGIVSAVVFLLAEPISIRFFSGASMTIAIKFMPAALVTGAVGSCLKGYFNAIRKAALTAISDVLEFIVKCIVIVSMTVCLASPDEDHVCMIMILSIIAGNVFSLVFLVAAYFRHRIRATGRATLSFGQYVSYSMPIMGGGALTALLSSTNDALIPICLRQYGDSAESALSLFGIFEAIVIPALFFPSVVLCSMSGMIVSEAARANARNDHDRICGLTKTITEWTLMFSVFAAAVLMRFGRPIGELLGGGELAGKMITIIAPVVPFIYMEIVLEALIKGMGLQAFSSINYLVEYIIRIAVVLILIPKIGFYGIVASYYASNIYGNSSRLIKIFRFTKASFKPVSMIIVPLIYLIMTKSLGELFLRITDLSGEKIPEMTIFVFIWGISYFAVFRFLGKAKLFGKRGETLFVKAAQ